MPRRPPLPSAWVARHGTRRQYKPKFGGRRRWRHVDARARYYGMHMLGLWPLWTIAICIVAGIWVAGYQDGLQ